MGKREIEKIFCASSTEAQLMTDDEFWDHVFHTEDMPDEDYWNLDHGAMDEFLGSERCSVCGCVGACGWDMNGLPLIHPRNEDYEGSWLPKD